MSKETKINRRYKNILILNGALFIVSLLSSYYFSYLFNSSAIIEFIFCVGVPGFFFGLFIIGYEKIFEIKSIEGKAVLVQNATFKVLRLELSKSNVSVTDDFLIVKNMYKYDLRIVEFFDKDTLISLEDFLESLPLDTKGGELYEKKKYSLSFSKILILILMMIFFYIYIFISPSF